MPTKYRCTIEDAKDCLALTVECAEDVAKLSRFLLPGTLVEADAVTEPIKYTVEAPAKPAKRTYKPRAAKPAPASLHVFTSFSGPRARRS